MTKPWKGQSGAGAASTPISSPYPLPPTRKLQVYAFDPQASVQLETAVINDAVISLPWEAPWEDPVTTGPCNEYIEVIDFDPPSGLFYAPVDLNDPILLAQNGLPPSEGRPQFHQQMVFAVAMNTIRLFERGLGRPVMWERQSRPGEKRVNKFIKQLRIYPHALRAANAYYSPEKTALLFGYFKKAEEESYDKDGGWVFTCLSRDIVAHETAHAILHGMQRRSIEATNADSLAFHEAFADIVALFQHFTMTDVVAHQIAHSRGSLRADGLLTGLAQQFGEATGRDGALRYALKKIAKQASRPQAEQAEQAADDGTPEEAQRISESSEPHDRGSFLVAAIFDAFVTIYERRTADLMRIATGGSAPDGRELQPDLVRRLAVEAGKAADHLLRMCVRALDYVPPVDVHFGEYLRAIITADADLVPDDPYRYRVAIAEAFRNRGIFVPGCLSMAPDSLMWERPDPGDLPGLLNGDATVGIFADLLPELKLGISFQSPQEAAQAGHPPRGNLREIAYETIQHNQRAIHEWLHRPSDYDAEWESLLGVKMLPDSRLKSIKVSDSALAKTGLKIPAVEVHSARIARRAGPDGQELHQLIIQVTQRRRGYFSEGLQKKADRGTLERTHPERWKQPDFWFRGGATLHTDLRDGRLRRVIRKRIDDDRRLAKERRFRLGMDSESGMQAAAAMREPFAFMHEVQSNG